MKVSWKIAVTLLVFTVAATSILQLQPKDGVLTKGIEINIEKGMVELPNATIATIMTNLSANKSFDSGLYEMEGVELVVTEIPGQKVAIYTIGLTNAEKTAFEDCVVYIKIYNSSLNPFEGEINILEDEALWIYTVDCPTGEWDFVLRVLGNTSSVEIGTIFNVIINLNISQMGFYATTDSEGRYEGSLPAGEFILTASKEGYHSQSKYVKMEEGKTIENFNFTLSPL